MRLAYQAERRLQMRDVPRIFSPGVAVRAFSPVYEEDELLEGSERFLIGLTL